MTAAHLIFSNICGLIFSVKSNDAETECFIDSHILMHNFEGSYALGPGREKLDGLETVFYFFPFTFAFPFSVAVNVIAFERQYSFIQL